MSFETKLLRDDRQSIDAVKKGLVSKSKLAFYLKINIGDVEQALSKYGYTLEDESNEELAVARR